LPTALLGSCWLAWGLDGDWPGRAPVTSGPCYSARPLPASRS